MSQILTLKELIELTGDRVRAGGDAGVGGAGMFELETEHILQVHVDGHVWIKAGGMIAYRGEMKFEREGLLSQGLGTLLKKAVSGEGASLTRAQGRGHLFLADKGKRVTLLELTDEQLFVNGSDLLCIEPRVKHEIVMMKKMSAIMSGGLFNVRLTGPGIIAITTHHRALSLPVTPEQPVFTDPQATVAWSGTLTPELRTDIQLKSLIGRGSGESFQMRFQGHGFVLVQPYEEHPLQAD